jgi:hypothetical protein
MAGFYYFYRMKPLRLLLFALICLTTLSAGARPVASIACQNRQSLKDIIHDRTEFVRSLNDIVSVTANRMPDHVVIVYWTTVKEGKDDHFEVERSLNGKDWTTIAEALAGTGIQDNSYEYIDKNVVAMSLYYRIRQKGEDGNYSFSAVVTVKGETRAAASIFFADRNISIRLFGGVKDTLEVSLLDQAGHLLQQRKYGDNGSVIRFSVADRAPGLYTVSVSDGIGLIGTKKLVFQ